MMNTPFEFIGEAQRESAFLTSATQADVARLERLTPSEWPGLDPENYLSDEEWQNTIDLVHYAPEMGKFIQALYNRLNSGTQMPPSDDDFWNPVRHIAPEIQF